MSLLRHRMMMAQKANLEPEPVDDTLIVFGNVDPSYTPVQGDYGFSCSINGSQYEYYQNDAPFYMYDSGDGWNYALLCMGAAGRAPSNFYHVQLPDGIMSEVNSYINFKDNTGRDLSFSVSVNANKPIYVVKSTTINGIEKYALAHKVQVGTVDETYVPYGDMDYGLRMTINGKYYHYYSDNPLYVLYNGSSYQLLGGGKLHRSPNQSFANTPSSDTMIYVDPNITRMESQTRTKAVIDSIISNHPVYLVKVVATNRYFYESTP